MRKIQVENIVRWVSVMLIQIMILNHIMIRGYLNPYLYILPIILLPGTMKGGWILWIGFLTGLIMDFAMNTYGVHAASTTAMAFLRIQMIGTLSGKTSEEMHRPGMQSMGTRGFLIYAGVLTLFHHILLNVLDVFRVSEILLILYRSVFSSALTFLLILLFQLLTQSSKRNAL